MQLQPNQSKVLRNVAGTWNMRTLNLEGDKVLLTYEIVAGDNTDGWSLNIPGLAPVPIRLIEVSGDSIVAEAEHPSVFRKGQRVATHFILQPHGDRLEGVLTSHYHTPVEESTVPLRVDGTRVGH